MSDQESISSELQPLYNFLSKWCDFLAKNNYSNFAEKFQYSFDCLHKKFSGDTSERYNALLDFQDSFKGGLGSINDISIDDELLRRAVIQERDLLIRKYYDLVFPKK